MSYFLVNFTPFLSKSSNFCRTENRSFNDSSLLILGSDCDFVMSGLIGISLNLPYPSHVLLSSVDCSFVEAPKFNGSAILIFSSTGSSSSLFNLNEPENISDLALLMLFLGSDNSFNSSSKLFKSPNPISSDAPLLLFPPFDVFFLSFINSSIPKLDVVPLPISCTESLVLFILIF